MKLKHCRLILSAVLVILSHFLSYSQVSGYILDQDGLPLPFATVLINGTSSGTSANLEGYYELELSTEGDYELIYSFVGFISQRISLNYAGGPLERNVRLVSSAIAIKEFVYDGNAEDPAYGIIREVQRKRKFFLEESPAYSCNSYMKGLIKIDTTPAMILGIPFEDILEDERNKILYLSESESTLLSDGGGLFKEIIHASVVSGEDQGLSFNSAKEMDFNLYKNFYQMPRPLISPIGKNALNFYKYKLKRSYYDDSNRKLYEIELWPKRADDPCYSGKIFIYDKTWDINASELGVNGKQCYSEGLDTMIVRQQYMDISGTIHKFPLNRNIYIRAGILGVQFSGNFNAVYSSYDLGEEKYLSLGEKEEFVYEAEALEKSKDYFDSIRPIPLNSFESVDYTFKDSLLQLEKDPGYRDSLDRVSNKFGVNKLVFGYTWRDSKKDLFITIPSPLESIVFNPVQGRNLSLSPRIVKYNSKRRTNYTRLDLNLNYGFIEQDFRYSLGLTRKFNSITNDKIRVDLGLRLVDFNDSEMIRPYIASLAALYFHVNPLKLYEKTFASLWFERDLGVQAKLRILGSWEARKSVQNNSDFSYFNTEGVYQKNSPIPDDVSFDQFNNSLFKTALSLRIYPGRKFMTYPERRVYTRSKWPVFNIKATALFYPKATSIKWSLGLRTPKMSLGSWGRSTAIVAIRGFLNEDSVQWIDFHHFRGNDIQFNSVKHIDRGYFLLPYYRLSTTNTHLTGIWEHSFDGKILNKVPLIKKMNVSLVGRLGVMVSNQDHYYECSVGIDRIGFKFWKGGRIDYVFKTSSSFANIERSAFKFSLSL